VYSGRSSPEFRPNLLPPSSRLKTKPSYEKLYRYREREDRSGVDDGGSRFLRNIGNDLPDCAASLPRRQSLRWKPQISLCFVMINTRKVIGVERNGLRQGQSTCVA
jgi:hypothetical protein